MNTQTLRQKFEDVYREFFSRCELVVSAPLNISLTGDYIASRGGLSIHQKLPLRLYVGFEINPETHQLSFGRCQFFNQTVDGGVFIEGQLDLIRRTEFLKFYAQTCFNDQLKAMPITIHVLSEVPLAAGMGDSGALAVCLAVGALALSHSLTPRAIDDWSKRDFNQLINDPFFDRVFRLAWRCRIVLRGGWAAGHSPLAILVDTFYPIIFITQALPQGDTHDSTVVNQLSYLAFKMEDISAPQSPRTWQFDWGLIHSGSSGDSNVIIRSTPTLNKILSETPPAAYQEFKQLSIVGRATLDTLLDQSSPDYYQILRILSLKSYLTLKTLQQEGLNNDRLEQFFQLINYYQQAMRLLGVSDRIIDGIISSLFERSRHWRLPKVAAKIIGPGGGEVLFMSPVPFIRQEIDDLIEELQKKYDPKIHLSYASWVDGYGHEGVRIEQMVGEKIYSPMISQGSLSVDYLNSQGEWQTHLFAKEHFQQMIGHQDIIFDAIENTVTISGERLTSQDIHSASATIQIFEILMKHCDQAVKNTDLPESIYATDRNELQSKIISPLNQAVAKRLGHRLPTKITGGVTEFTITLQPGLPIYFIKKVF